MDSVLVCLAAIIKYYNPVVKKKKLKLIFSHSSGGWEVQVQGASMNGFCWGSGL